MPTDRRMVRPRRASLAVGVLSGTSADGVDVAVVAQPSGRPRILARATFPYASATRRLLVRPGSWTLDTVARLHRLVAEDFAAAIERLLRSARIAKEEIAIVGSHGQTIWHRPRVMSLQLGAPAVIAARLGIPVAADFRPDDVAVGGEGAPFVPVLDGLLLGPLTARRGGPRLGALNLGGIANLTVVARGRVEAAWDCGPANGPVDAVARRRLGRPFDRDAVHARRGRVNARLLGALLEHAYFRRRPPKSTGLEEFGAELVADVLRSARRVATADLLRTFVELAAVTAARDIARSRLDRVYVSGGGWRNPLLRERLAALAAPTTLVSTSELGIDPDAKEALLFAVLGWKRLHREPVDLRAVTGATRPKILGGLWLP